MSTVHMGRDQLVDAATTLERIIREGRSLSEGDLFKELQAAHPQLDQRTLVALIDDPDFYRRILSGSHLD